MTPDTFGDRKLYAWLLGCAAALVAIVYLLAGCGGDKGHEPDVPKLIDCASEVVRIVTTTPDCSNIARELDKLLAAQAECMQALTGERVPQWTCDTDGGMGR